MPCLKILSLAVALLVSPPHAGGAEGGEKPRAKKPVQVAYLDCRFDAANVYRCRP